MGGNKIIYSVVLPSKARRKKGDDSSFNQEHGKQIVVSREMVQELIKDLHSRDTEVEHIGFLGGAVKDDVLYLTHYKYSNHGTSNYVEAKPGHEREYRKELKALGRVLTSWWHSHPGQGPYPSISLDKHDLKTQRRYKREIKNTASLVFDTKKMKFSAFDVEGEKFVFVPVELKSGQEIEEILEEKNLITPSLKHSDVRIPYPEGAGHKSPVRSDGSEEGGD